MQGFLFSSEVQCGYCATRGHHWVECPGRGVALCRKCMRGGHRATSCPKEYYHPDRVMVRRFEGEPIEVRNTSFRYEDEITIPWRPTLEATLGMMRSPDHATRQAGARCAVERIREQWESDPSPGLAVLKVEAAVRGVLLAVMRNGDDQEKIRAKAMSKGELKQEGREGWTGGPRGEGHVRGQWQEALGARNAREGDLLEADFLHEDWEERYPALEDEEETEAVRLMGKATRALKDALRRPEDSLVSKRFWEDPGTTRLFDVEPMMQGKRMWTNEGGEDGQFDEDDEDLPEVDGVLVRHIMGIRVGDVEDVLATMFHKKREGQ